ncbi:MAG: protein kinase [Armatimonadota bacterium]|nr:protein kinase [Armatimonadota bacterium]
MEIEIGSRLGPYEVREKIGEGGMATVYKVWHTGLHRFEALKLPHHQNSYDANPPFVQRLLAEARTAARLHHPNIVAIHNVSDADAALHFFTMDYVAGYDLSVLLKQRRRLPLPEALTILRQVADALDCAHAHGVIHRDVKPGNILLQEASAPGGWVARVVDFGISRAVEDTEGTKLTRSGMIVGTPEYMSAEQAGNGDTVDYRTDIYSLGIVAYEMLSGHPPFEAGEGVSRMSILMAHIHTPPKPPIEHVPDLPLAANNAILKALAKHPAQRFDSCADFMKALSGAVTVIAPEHQDTIIAAPGGASTLATTKTPTVAPPPAAPPVATMPEKAPPEKTPAEVATLTSIPEVRHEPPPHEPQPGKMKAGSRSLLALWSVIGLGGVAAIVWGLVNSNSQSSESSVSVAPPPETTPAPTVAAPPTPEPTFEPTVVPTPAATSIPRRVTRLRRTEKIPYPRQTQRTAALFIGQERTRQRGQEGVREVTVEVTTQGQRELARRRLSSRVIKQPIPQIELVGTKAKASLPRPVRTVSRRPAPKKVAPRRARVRRATRVRRTRRTRGPREAPPPRIEF